MLELSVDPVSHGTHVMGPSGGNEYAPAQQLLQVVDPECNANVPEGQTPHTPCPVVLVYVPMLHRLHVALDVAFSSEEYLPALHNEQFVAPTKEE